MQKIRVAFTALALAITNPAWAAPAAELLPGPPPPATLTSQTPATGGISASVFASPTVKDFLAICGDNQGGCDDEVDTALIDKMVFDGTANICLPGPDYAGPALKWLGTHPDTNNMRTEDGIYLALQKVYPCG